jgi:hypothetical protein
MHTTVTKPTTRRRTRAMRMAMIPRLSRHLSGRAGGLRTGAGGAYARATENRGGTPLPKGEIPTVLRFSAVAYRVVTRLWPVPGRVAVVTGPADDERASLGI